MAQRKTKSDKSSYVPKYKEFISLAEFNRRKTIYNEYYTRCRDTRAYRRFCEIRDAFMRGDKNTVYNNYKTKTLTPIESDRRNTIKQLAEEARQALADGVKEVATPPFPDPEIQRRLHYLGIEEWDKTYMDTASNIFNEPF